MRKKYKIWFIYPIFKNSEVVYTTSKNFYFHFKLLALVLKFILKIYKLVFINKEFKKYYHITLFYIPKYNIDSDIGIDWQDSGQWRSFNLYATGDSMKELIEEACISEIDQDGGELNSYGLEHASNEVFKEALAMLKSEIKTKGL